MTDVSIFSLMIYQAKSYGSARRAGGFFADGFALGDGVAALTGAALDLVNKKIVPVITPGSDQTKLGIGSAISSGDFIGYAISRVFDGNAATQWISTQANLNEAGVSYVGWDF